MANDPTDTELGGIPVLTYIRDDIARILHDLEHGKNKCSCDGGWMAWRPEADAIMPSLRSWLAEIWSEGARSGARGFNERTTQNPYRKHVANCACPYCYSAAMGGGR